MNIERAVAILATLIALGLLATVPGSLSGYRQSANASEWQTTYGRVTERTNVSLPSFVCFVRGAHYSLIRYSYLGADGKENKGAAQAPQQPDMHPGSTIEIRFNPNEPNQSLPVASIRGYSVANAGMLLVALPLALAFLYVARRLWREGAKTRSNTTVNLTTVSGALSEQSASRGCRLPPR